MDTYSNTSSSMPPAAVAFLLITIVATVILYVIVSLCLMTIFKKAGVKNAWAAWVPYYNSWKTLQIGGQQGFWAILSVIPLVNIVAAVFLYIAMYHIGKKLGKSDAFVLLAVFIPIVWYIWLAVDDSKWNDAASTAPSLEK
jgi:hypothetical protein